MYIALVASRTGAAPAVERIVSRMGHVVHEFKTPESLFDALRNDKVDMVMVPWNRRTQEVQALIRRIRDESPAAPPVLAVSDKVAKRDITDALHAGANDSIIVPGDERTAMARISAWLDRRRQRQSAGNVVMHGPFRFDRSAKRAWLGAKEIVLTAKEFQLADLLFSRLNRAVSRTMIMETVWRKDPGLATRTLDMHVSRLRTKLGLGTEVDYQISTVFGYGYRLETVEPATVRAKAG